MKVVKSTAKARFLRENGLSIILILMFFLSWAGQFFTGHASHNEDLKMHGFAAISMLDYFQSGHFIESTFENWESEFLQMAVFVWLTAKAFQRGSAESNPLPDEQTKKKPRTPMRYFRGRPLLRKLYENSLSLALLLIFALSFGAHLYGGWKEENLKHLIAHDEAGQVSLAQFFMSSDFWFQSFQNWQSEFLSVAVIVILTIFLRQKDSAQSKDMDMPHWETKT